MLEARLAAGSISSVISVVTYDWDNAMKATAAHTAIRMVHQRRGEGLPNVLSYAGSKESTRKNSPGETEKKGGGGQGIEGSENRPRRSLRGFQKETAYPHVAVPWWHRGRNEKGG